jgi:hypothetical protein
VLPLRTAQRTYPVWEQFGNGWSQAVYWHRPALGGIPTVAFGKLEIGLSLSVGVLLKGLVWSWFNSVHPMLGRIPTPTVWIFETRGLTGLLFWDHRVKLATIPM